jgi:predicted phosphodiesterase
LNKIPATFEEMLAYAKAHPEKGRICLSKDLNISDDAARGLVAMRGGNCKTNELALELALKEKGLTIEDFNRLFEVKKQTITRALRKVNNRFSVGIMGDTHCGDKAHALDELHDYYRICREEGCEIVLHAGDITAGIDVYKGQTADLLVYGFDDQIKNCIVNYPKLDGIDTYVINGNHDLGFKATAGANFCEALSTKRSDIKFCGDYDASISLNGIDFGLHHGSGGGTYALSYKLQKYIEKIGGGQKPQVYVLGHYHSALSLFYRNIHCFMPACFQKPTDFSVRLGLPNCVGGYIAEIETADDEFNSITSIRQRFISYY